MPLDVGGSLCEQLDGWARHVATVQQGGLQLSRQLCSMHAIDNSSNGQAKLSPKLDVLATAWCEDEGIGAKLVPVPTAGALVDLDEHLQAAATALTAKRTFVRNIRCDACLAQKCVLAWLDLMTCSPSSHTWYLPWMHWRSA